MAQCARLVVLAAILLGVSAVTALAQSAGKSVSGVLTVSVTVVRSCAIETPSSLGSQTSASEVRVGCGHAPTTTRVSSNSILPVAGIPAPAVVSSSKNQHGLVVGINF